jgi:hypothetical protein
VWAALCATALLVVSMGVALLISWLPARLRPGEVLRGG